MTDQVSRVRRWPVLVWWGLRPAGPEISFFCVALAGSGLTLAAPRHGRRRRAAGSAAATWRATASGPGRTVIT